MKRELLNRLRSPCCHERLTLSTEGSKIEEIRTGKLTCDGCGHRYPIQEYIPRFVPAENYASNFGLQWNRFRQTQLDSFTGVQITRQRFFNQSGWLPKDLKDKWVLDVGCGAGRFAEIALDCGANLVALDFSTAVDACWQNHRQRNALHVVQGSVYQFPFCPASFDYVYCFGVLQHTPDVKTAFQALTQQLREGGRLAVDVYPKLLLNWVWPKYWLRPLTRRIPPELLFRITERMVRVLLPLSLLVGRIPRLGGKLRYLIPVVNYEGKLPLTPDQIREWAFLDTFDILSAAHDQPQTIRTIERWFREAGLSQVNVFRKGQVVGLGTKSVEPQLRDAHRADGDTRNWAA